MEGCCRIGIIHDRSTNGATKAHINAIQASLLGLLALLLGFTFSLALQRFDSRSEAVVDEANAIGTAFLRAQLLPTSVRSEAQQLLKSYVDLRAQAGAVTLSSETERQALLDKANLVLDALWSRARRAAEAPNPVTSGLFIQSLNGAIDSYGKRNAELSRHVPEAILFLLYGSFTITSGVIGYAAGVAGHCPTLATYVMVTLIVVLAFIIVDLDRPRRGLIKVDQFSLIQLKEAIHIALDDDAQPAVHVESNRPALTDSQ